MTATSGPRGDSEHRLHATSTVSTTGERLRKRRQPSAADAQSRQLSWCVADTVDNSWREDERTRDTVGVTGQQRLRQSFCRIFKMHAITRHFIDIFAKPATKSLNGIQRSQPVSRVKKHTISRDFVIFISTPRRLTSFDMISVFLFHFTLNTVVPSLRSDRYLSLLVHENAATI